MPNVGSYQDDFSTPLEKKKNELLYIKAYVKYWAYFSKGRCSKTLGFLENISNDPTVEFKICFNFTCALSVLGEFKWIPWLWPLLSKHFKV